MESEMASKNYWDELYNNEMANFGEIGTVEVWFGKSTAPRIVEWLNKREDVKKEDAVIDLGCGNGWTLVVFAKSGFSNLTGVDYSENALQLATQVTTSYNVSSVIKFEVCDLVDQNSKTTGVYKIAVDKGTFDAVTLSKIDLCTNVRSYKASIRKLLDKEGYFIISSCNWTEDELQDFFEDCFDYVDKLPPLNSFTYGGSTGYDCTTLIFKN